VLPVTVFGVVGCCLGVDLGVGWLGGRSLSGTAGLNELYRLRNIEAFLTLQKLFIKCLEWPGVQESLLDRILAIFCNHPDNYRSGETSVGVGALFHHWHARCNHCMTTRECCTRAHLWKWC